MRIQTAMQRAGVSAIDHLIVTHYHTDHYGGVPELALFSRAQLSLALGRENVVHAALKRGGLAARAWADAERLSGFRLLVPEEWALES